MIELHAISGQPLSTVIQDAIAIRDALNGRLVTIVFNDSKLRVRKEDTEATISTAYVTQRS